VMNHNRHKLTISKRCLTTTRTAMWYGKVCVSPQK
jgi:hypothetical protein